MSIYMYFTAEGGKFCLEGRRLKASEPRAFNDPFDCQPVLLDPDDKDVQLQLQERIQRRMDRGDFEKAHHQQMVEYEEWKLYKSIRENRGDLQNHLHGPGHPILCFTRTAHHPLMWAHYADRHRGMLLEFDDSHPWFNDRLVNVVYSEVRPRIYHYRNSRNIRELFIYKALEWSYEQEMRIFPEISPEVERVKEDGYLRYYFNFPIDIIRSVIIGMKCRIKPEVVDQVKRLRESGARITLQRASLGSDDFKIVFEPINVL